MRAALVLDSIVDLWWEYKVAAGYCARADVLGWIAAGQALYKFDSEGSLAPIFRGSIAFGLKVDDANRVGPVSVTIDGNAIFSREIAEFCPSDDPA